MKHLFRYSFAIFFTALFFSSCGNRGNEANDNKEPEVNVSDSRRNTTGTVNTITGDSSKVATDSAQHEIRGKKRE